MCLAHTLSSSVSVIEPAFLFRQGTNDSCGFKLTFHMSPKFMVVGSDAFLLCPFRSLEVFSLLHSWLGSWHSHILCRQIMYVCS